APSEELPAVHDGGFELSRLRPRAPHLEVRQRRARGRHVPGPEAAQGLRAEPGRTLPPSRRSPSAGPRPEGEAEARAPRDVPELPPEADGSLHRPGPGGDDGHGERERGGRSCAHGDGGFEGRGPDGRGGLGALPQPGGDPQPLHREGRHSAPQPELPRRDPPRPHPGVAVAAREEWYDLAFRTSYELDDPGEMALED